MRHFCLSIAYDGKNYCGWQKQSQAQEKKRSSIASILEKAIKKVTQSEVHSILGSGRTDSGVHARAQSAHLRCQTKLEASTLLKAINHFLPKDIRVLSIVEKDKDFHAQKYVKSKCYRYFILHNTRKEHATSWPFLFSWSWYFIQKLDYKRIQEALSYLEGRHDFAAFQNVGTTLSSTVRHIFEAKLILHELDEDPHSSFPWMPLKSAGLNLLEVRITGDGFLKQMVRNIVGTIMEVGKGNLELEKIKKLLNEKKRQNTGITAPAQGLFLNNINYRP